MTPDPKNAPIDCADLVAQLRQLVERWTQYSELPAHDIDPANEHEPGYIDGWREAMAGAASVLKATLGSAPASSDDKPEQDAKRDFLTLFSQLPKAEQDKLLDELDSWDDDDNDDRQSTS